MEKRHLIAFGVLAMGSTGLLLSALEPASAGNIPSMVAQRCAKEIQDHCKGVIPGEGRVVACLYAHSNSISYDCAYTMYDASEQLASIRAALDQIAQNTSCRSEIALYCRNDPPQAGLIYHCLKKNRARLTEECRTVLPKAEQLLLRAGVIGN